MADKKKTLRAAIDILMVALLPVLMAYSLVGELLHEIAGTLMLALFIAHHILNHRATAAMFRDRQTPERVFGTVVNLLLFAVMVLLPASGILMSKRLYAFLPTEGLSLAARTVHLLTSYWGFALMSVHLGQHVDRMTVGMKKRKGVWLTVASALTLIACYGAYEFIRRGLWQYMTLKTQFVFFDYDEPRILFFAGYLSMIVFFAWIGYFAKKAFHMIGKKK